MLNLYFFAQRNEILLIFATIIYFKTFYYEEI